MCKGHSTGPVVAFKELGHSLGGEKLFNTRSRFIPSPFSPGKAALPRGRGSGHRECESSSVRRKGRLGRTGTSVASWGN